MGKRAMVKPVPLAEQKHVKFKKVLKTISLGLADNPNNC